MNKKQFIELVRQYSQDTAYLSCPNTKHLVYQELMQAPEAAVIWALELLRESIDPEVIYSPWFLFELLDHFIGQEYGPKLSEEHYGMLDEIRAAWLQWGVSNRYITNV
jgi:hypothetical protein